MITAAARTAYAATASVAVVLGVAVLWMFDPSAAGSRFPPCVFRLFTGLYCPGCGMTRMLHALVHGDVARAASMNVLALVGLPVLGFYAVEQAAGRRWLQGAARSVVFNGRLWIAAALVFGVLRNLPWTPFTALAPG